MNTTTVFLQTISLLIQSIGRVFESVDKLAYHFYLCIFDHYLDKALMKYLQTSQCTCFMIITILWNNCVYFYKNSMNYQDEQAVITCVGSFKGNDLCLPGLEVHVSKKVLRGVQIGYKPEDVIFLHAVVIEHFIFCFIRAD